MLFDDIRNEAEIIASGRHRKRKTDLISYDKRTKHYYLNIPSALDIETTSFYEGNEKRACMVCFGMDLLHDYRFGRDWDEFMHNLNDFNSFVAGLGIDARAIIFIHNLSYEFQFMAKRLQNEGEIYELLATDTRKPIKFNWQSLEFRCSYFLAGYSLGKVGEMLGYEKGKDWDYRLIRNCKTPLSDEEIFYQQRDCEIVTKFVEGEICRYGNITNIPLTNTGNVRKELRKYAKGNEEFKRAINQLQLSTPQYKLLKSAFMGGYTHASPLHVGQTLCNVASYDFTSSYPAVMLTERFPSAVARHIDQITVDELKQYIKKGYLAVFTATFENMKARPNMPDYYISLHKSKTHYARNDETRARIKVDNVDRMTVYNGRIEHIAGYLRVDLTSVDLDIIERVYTFDRVAISNCYIYFTDYLPASYFHCIIDLYMSKCVLKGVKGKEDEYQHKKGMLNSIYGMTVEDVVKDLIDFTDDGWEVIEKAQFDDKTFDDAIFKYNRKRNRITAYVWGVFVTAFARRNLWTGIIEFGPDYVYSDTDSIKCLNASNHKKYIDNYNNLITRKLEKAFKEKGINTEFMHDAKYKPIGVWDYEGEYLTFKTLGAKRYLVEDNEGLHLTCSGVRKEAVKTITCFDDFKDGLYFGKEATGKLIHTYLDGEFAGQLTDYLGNVADYHELSAVHLDDADFTISIDGYVKDTIWRNCDNGKGQNDKQKGQNEILFIEPDIEGKRTLFNDYR